MRCFVGFDGWVGMGKLAEFLRSRPVEEADILSHCSAESDWVIPQSLLMFAAEVRHLGVGVGESGRGNKHNVPVWVCG